uniref:secreted RxLR effector protein 161-like n=1 Tax=Erigeron canadensis TaxID=72917 RepID=UPI001CB8B9ED|nr:secreted RxLR effector protein 161-like [Erigeron canadensis]
MSPPNNLHADPDGKHVNPTYYRGMIGSLMYLTASRPDIMFSTCLCARHQASPHESHLLAVKRIFKYLKGTPTMGLWSPRDSNFDLVGFSDSDYVGCMLDRKSTGGGCQLLGGRLTSWTSKKQHTVSISIVEAEYVSAASCCAQMLWMKHQLADYDLEYSKIPIMCDNTSAIAITQNPVQHSKTKNIDIRYHFIQMVVKPNNHPGSSDVPKGTKGYKPMLDFIHASPASRCIMADPEKIFVHLLREFWWT